MLAGQEDKFHMLIRETKVEESDRRKREEENRRRLEEERKQRQLEEKRQREEEERRKREEEERRLKEEQRLKEERERLERERLEAMERARKLEEERLQKLQEEEELKRQEREAKLFAELGSQGVPTFGLEEGDVIREGFLQRKNELDEGGRKAATRSWKNHYTVLIGPLLNFYKDKRDFQQYISACPPINVSQGVCEEAKDYQKRKNALRLKLPSGAEYLFVARDEADVVAWVQAISSVIQGGGSAAASSSSSTVSSPPQSVVGSPGHLVEPPAEPTHGSTTAPRINGASSGSKTNGSAALKTTSDALDMPPEFEPPPPPPSVPLPEDEPVTEELPLPQASVKPHPSPSLPATTRQYGHHRAPPPPPSAAAPPTQEEAGKSDGPSKTGKKTRRGFKMFTKK